MQPEFQCQKCEESFGVDISDLSSDPTLRCPSCGAHAPGEMVEALVGALEDLFAAIAPLRRKFMPRPTPLRGAPTQSSKQT